MPFCRAGSDQQAQQSNHLAEGPNPGRAILTFTKKAYTEAMYKSIM